MSSRLGRYRRSCDRCHYQKLRCKRDEGESVCQRCTRAKAKCTFSAITRSKPAAAFVQSNYTAAAANAPVPPTIDQLDFEYPTTSQTGLDVAATREAEPASFDFLLNLSTPTCIPGSAEMEWDGFLGQNGLQSVSPDDTLAASVEAANAYGFSPLTATDLRASNGRKSHQNNLFQSSSISTPPRNFDSAFRRRSGSSLDGLTHAGSVLAIERLVPLLSNLSVELHQFALTIPSVESCIDAQGKYEPLENREFALDRMLKLSQRFIEILNRLHVPVRAASSSASSTHSESLNSMPSLSEVSSSTGSSSSSSALIDQPCELLVLSCYMRIVETYHSFLQHVQECAKVHMRVPDHTLSADTLYRLPALSVGTFTMESTTSTHVSLLVHMIEAMMTRSRVLIQAIMRVCAVSPTMSLSQWDSGALPKQSAAQAALSGFRPQEERTIELLMKVRRVLLDVAEVQWSGGI